MLNPQTATERPETSPTVPVPRAWIERLIEMAYQVSGRVESRMDLKLFSQTGMPTLLGYIESARSLITDVTKPE